MRCVCKIDIYVLVTLKQADVVSSCYIKCQKMFFCTQRSDSQAPPTLWKLDFRIIDNNLAVFFDLDTA